MTKLIRTFHPVGHGAFYSEKHCSGNQVINIIYDCGSLHHQSKLETECKATFHKKEEIKILFISHFDYDHISGIPSLIKNYKIKTVVMPLIMDEESKIVIKAYNMVTSGNDELNDLIDNPEKFFNDTKVVKVRPIEKEKDEDIEQPINESDLDSEIKSGISICISPLSNSDELWCYIPFNYQHSSRMKEFKEKIKAKKLDFDMLKDAQYIMDNKPELKAIFKEIDGTINTNSLVLFSGKKDNPPMPHLQKRINQKEHIRYWHHPYRAQLSCLYLGDSETNTKKFWKQLKPKLDAYLPSIGVIQIAHHGSIYNFSSDILQWSLHPAAIISCNSGDEKHPSSKVLSNIINCLAIPFLITEESKSKFVQTGRY